MIRKSPSPCQIINVISIPEIIATSELMRPVLAPKIKPSATKIRAANSSQFKFQIVLTKPGLAKSASHRSHHDKSNASPSAKINGGINLATLAGNQRSATDEVELTLTEGTAGCSSAVGLTSGRPIIYSD